METKWIARLSEIPPVPGLVSRYFGEILLAAMSVFMALGISLHGDASLGGYFIWYGAASLQTVCLVWSVVFGISGVAQMVAILWCRIRGGNEGSCIGCPYRPSCGSWRMRRYAAFASACIWGCLFIVLVNGRSDFMTLLVVPVAGIGELIIYSILRPGKWTPA